MKVIQYLLLTMKELKSFIRSDLDIEESNQEEESDVSLDELSEAETQTSEVISEDPDTTNT